MKRLAQPSALLMLCALLIPLLLNAQKDPIKWGKVSEKDLKMTVYEADTTADALVLADYATLDFDFSSGEARYVFHRHRRIKILKRSGFKYGDISISVFNDDKISGLKAQAISPNGEEYKVKKSEIYEEETTDKWSRTKFSFPQITEGAVLEYEYSLNSGDFFNLERWYFQDYIPVRHSELRLDIPEWYNYLFFTQGRRADIAEQEMVKRTLRVPMRKERTTAGLGNTTSTHVSSTISANVNKHRYVMKNVPAFKEEAYMTTANDHIAKIDFQLQSVKYPNSIIEPILSSWPEVAKELSEHEHFGRQYTQKRRYKKLLEAMEPVLKKGTTKDEKALLAYQFLAENMEWTGKYTFLADKNLDDCFEERKGNSVELNLMLLAILNELGVEAYPLLVSTREHGKMLTLYPIINQFNHMLVAASVGGTLQIMDVGSAQRPVGLPRVASLNGKAWVASMDNPQWIDLTPPLSTATNMFDLTLSPEGQVAFSMRGQYEGYDAMELRQSFKKDAEGKFLKEEWQERLPECTLESISVDETANLTAPFKIEVSGDVSELTTSLPNFIYLTPTVEPIIEENPFKLEQRDYPVNFPYPFKIHNLVFVNKPEGYVVDDLPESIRLNLPNGGGTFEYLINEAGNKISIITKLEIKQLIYTPEEYQAIKSFFAMILEKQGEQLVFVKKT